MLQYNSSKHCLNTDSYVHVVKSKRNTFSCDCATFRLAGQQCCHIELLQSNMINENMAQKLSHSNKDMAAGMQIVCSSHNC